VNGRTTLCEIEVLAQIRQKLDEARSLAVGIGGFNIFYMIDIALFETNDMLYRYHPDTDESDKPSADITSLREGHEHGGGVAEARQHAH
jgi:hypothetical protein